MLLNMVMFKVTICDLKNKDRNMADNMEHQDKGELAGCCQYHGSHGWQDDQSAEHRHRYCSLRYGGEGWRDSPFGNPIRPAVYRIGRIDGLLRLLIFFSDLLSLYNKNCPHLLSQMGTVSVL